MRAFSLTAVVLAAGLALAGCDSATDTGSGTEESAAETDVASEEPVAEAEEAAVAPATEPSTIPSAIRGRWGLVAADCEPGRADAKGLLEIDPTVLTFYESRGKLDSIREAGPDRIDAGFDFSGEGMTWQRRMVLEVLDGGDTLVRREYGEEAAPGPLRYMRCPD